MDSKEILETFGISKNFGIVLLIQSIIIIIGCFLAIQDMYYRFSLNNSISIIKDIVNLLFSFFNLLFLCWI